MIRSEQFGAMSDDELLTLLRYHSSQVGAVAQEIAVRGGGNHRSAPAAPTPPSADDATPQPGPESTHYADWATTYTDSRADAVLVEQVLRRSTDEMQAAVVELVEEVTAFDGVRSVIPEHPRDKKPPTYLRFACWDRTFGYVNVRRDSLRIDLAMPAEDAAGHDNARVRDVKDDNPLKVSLYVRSPEDVVYAIEAMQHARNLADEAVRA